MRWHYEKPERLHEFEALVVERNVVDWVLVELRQAGTAAGATECCMTATRVRTAAQNPLRPAAGALTVMAKTR